MSRGPRSTAPDLPGFTPDRWIGGGGFADVFLYNQLRPSRSVAVKILRREHLSAQALAQFDAEADIMAEVSTHPYIVTIFASGVSPDGRPFIVMEHYPQPNFGERAKGGILDFSEVLRTGIQVASAVETAHRAGIIHRDIKPANILTSTFGRPGLTDFGISGVQTEGALSEAIGITVAYTAPELLNEESAGSVATDVYGLGATVSALAAGHSPFWSPSGDNGDQAVLARALAGQIVPIGRPEAPASLNNLVAQAMHPDPRHRPTSALAFAQSLQQIEQELRLQPTPIDVADLGGHARSARNDGDEDERTRRPVQVVDPLGTADPSVPIASRAPAPPDPTRPGTSTPPAVPFLASSTPSPAPATPTPSTISFAPPATPPTPSAPAARSTPTSPITSAPVPVAPSGPRIPAVTTTPSWAREAPTGDEDAETVARPRARGAFVPPTVHGAPAPAPVTSPPIPLDSTTAGPTPAPEPEAPTPRARRPFPTKSIAIGVVLLVAVAAVIFLASQGSRDAKDAPGTQHTASGGPKQSIVVGSDGGQPTVTPNDLALGAFTVSGTTATAQLTWTADTDRSVLEGIAVAPYPTSADSNPIVSASFDSPSRGSLTVTLTLTKTGACVSADIGGHGPLPCEGGPPCIRMTAHATKRGIGDPKIAFASATDSSTPLLKTNSRSLTAAEYDEACSSAFPATN